MGVQGGSESDGAVRAERAYESARLGYDAGLTDLNTALGAEQIWRQQGMPAAPSPAQAFRATLGAAA